jgi:hypothetical protein
VVRVKRRAVFAVLAAGMSAALVAIAGPANAATYSIDITTTKAMATGQFTRVSEQGGQPLVWRPSLGPINASVVCPAGTKVLIGWFFASAGGGAAAIPTTSHVDCTGQSQQVVGSSRAGTSGPGNPMDVTVTATMYDPSQVVSVEPDDLALLTPLASDSQVVKVVTQGYVAGSVGIPR